MYPPTITIGGTTYHPPRIFCIGVNYSAHQKEMGKSYADRCVIFTKPSTSLVPPEGMAILPKEKGAIHHEVELVVAIGEPGKHIAAGDALSHIAGLAVGCDLTLRELQTTLRESAKPWDLAKGFDHSALISRFVPFSGQDLDDITLRCSVNGDTRQDGNTRDMLFKVPTLIEILSDTWELLPGDLIYTGTPEGVGPVAPGDEIVLAAGGIGEFRWHLT